MEIVTNSQLNHLSTIRKLLIDSDKVTMAVAFLKESGLNEINNDLINFLRKGCQIKIICGLDFGLTEPTALHKLHLLSSKYSNLQLKIYQRSVRIDNFHPKVYIGENKTTVSLVVGSANLTAGGLKDNNECSIALIVSRTSEMFLQVRAYLDSLLEASESSTLLGIMQYKAYYNKQKKIRKALQLTSNSDDKLFNYENLATWLKEYRAENDIDIIFARKNEHYDEAKIVLDTIANAKNLRTLQFIPLFERLVGSKTTKALWHSGSIFRTKTKVFNNPQGFQKLVRFIRDNRQKKPSVVFEGAKQRVVNIEGSGINTVTEIMMTYNRTEFANLNKNPITVLREEGGVDLKAHRNSFNGYDYELYCDLVTEISHRLGLRNMLEADSFFNDVYWQIQN